jgi:hypothetical protein
VQDEKEEILNAIAMQQAVFELPGGALRDEQLEHLSVEEIYEILLKDVEKYKSLWEGSGNEDLLDTPGETCAVIECVGANGCSLMNYL